MNEWISMWMSEDMSAQMTGKFIQVYIFLKIPSYLKECVKCPCLIKSSDTQKLNLKNKKKMDIMAIHSQ